MSADRLELASDFPPRTEEDWRPVAEASLKGKPLATLTKQTADGLHVHPLYGPEQDLGPDAAGWPGQAPFVRGQAAAAQGWSIAAEHHAADLGELAAGIVAELERGVNEVHLTLDAAARGALAPDEAGDALAQHGAPVHTLDDLQLALDGVHEDAAPVTPDAGGGFAGAAALFVALFEARGRDLSSLRGSLGADPLGALAAEGTLPGGLDGALSALGEIAAWIQDNAPGLKTARVRTAVYNAAGAGEAQELACALTTAIAYMRAMIDAGLSPDAAAGQIELELTVSARFFVDIAKLRAARRLWAKVQAAFGVETPALSVHATASSRVLTRRDPWVNMLRGTAACFAGATGGAQSICLPAFDAALGSPGELGRRIARNTQVILQEESHLGLVTDPAGGAWFIEALTEQLAHAAWAELQAIEGEGGLAESLRSGAIAARLEHTWDRRAAAIAKRKQPITGVSEFPNLAEAPVEARAADVEAARRAALDRLGASARPAVEAEGFAAAVAAAKAGATLAALNAALVGDGEAEEVAALPAHRDAEGFEALRDASDAQASRPKALLVNLGTVAQHTARATWAKSFFEAGGIEAVADGGLESPAAAVEALKASGAAVAVICGTDGLYETEVERFAPALREAGAKLVFVAGNPKDKREAYEAAGVTGFVHVGCDVLGTLQDVAKVLGVVS